MKRTATAPSPPSQTSTEFHLSHLRTASAARAIRESVAVEG